MLSNVGIVFKATKSQNVGNKNRTSSHSVIITESSMEKKKGLDFSLSNITTD